MSIAKTEALLEATRQKIAEQLSMVGRSIQSIDPTLYDKEQELERLLKHLQEVRDAPTRSQKVLLVNEFENKREHWNACKHAEIEDGDIAMPQTEFKEAVYELAFGDNAINRGFSEEEVIATIKGFAHDSWVAEEFDHGTAMPSVAPAVLELLTPPVKRFFRNGVEHTLIQEQSNEEIDAFIERKILEEPDGLIKATYYGNTPETCRQIIRSYLEYSQFGKLIEEHPNNYKALEPFKGWWNDYISDGEDEFVEQANLADLIAPHEGDKE
jgi:hypothetical protein